MDAIASQGRQTGENFNNKLYTSPRWRPHSPEKWMDTDTFIVPTSQTLLKNLKDKVEQDVKVISPANGEITESR